MERVFSNITEGMIMQDWSHEYEMLILRNVLIRSIFQRLMALLEHFSH